MSREPVRRGRSSVLTAYYLATPLFVVPDVVFSLPVRAAGIPSPGARWAYYALLLALGLVCRRWPDAAPWTGMAESAVNILLLILAVMIPIWSMPDAALAGEPLPDPFGAVSVFTFILSGAALVVAFHGHQRRALRRPATVSRSST